MSEPDLALLLAEGLDLCDRARKLDDQIQRAVRAGMGEIFPGATRCGTPALWVQQAYDSDLAEWEARAKAALMRIGFQYKARTSARSEDKPQNKTPRS